MGSFKVNFNMFINSCDKSGLAIVKIHLHESHVNITDY